jgi:hypothetical protein
MKRLLFGAVLLTFIFALTCGATDTRVLTLGQANMIVKDDANILTEFFGLNPMADHQVGFPQLISMYRGMVVGDVSSSVSGTLYRVGAHYDMGEGKSVIGVYVDNRPWPYNPSLSPNQPMPEAGGVGNRLNLIYGRPLGDMEVGLNLMLFSNSHTIEDSGTFNMTQSNMGLGVNLGLTMMENLDLGLGIRMGSWKNEDANGTAISEPKSNFGIIFGGRYWWKYNDQVDFVPHLQFVMDGAGFSIPNTGEFTDKSTTITVGMGANVRPVDRVLLLFDLGVNLETETLESSPTSGTATEDKYTHMDFPYYKIGLEGEVTKWWDVRLGAVKMWHSAKDELQSGGVEKRGTTSTSTYLGSGFHFGNLTLDAWIDPDFVLRGPNFISGYNQDLAGQVSILYAWK